MSTDTRTDWLSSTEAAARVGMTPKSFRMFADAGNGPPYYQLGYRRKYDPADVAAWIAANRVDPAEATAS